MGTQAHPELKSRPTRPHPLFVGFVGAALDYKAAERLPMEIAEQRANGADERVREELTLPNTPTVSGSGCKSPCTVAEHDFETLSSETLYVGNIFALRADEVRMPGGRTARREVVEHYGAVAVVAMDDEQQRRDGLPVPASGGTTAVGAARRPARRRG